MDWSADVFPRLVKAGAPLYGWVAEGYWQDVGTHESYLKAQADVLSGQVEADIDGFEISPGIWVAEGAEVDPEAVLTGPLCIGEYAKIEAGAELREFTVVGSNVVVKEGAFSCTGPWCTTTCSSARESPCAAASSARRPT